MFRKIDCELVCSSSSEHLSQIYTGFGLLASNGLITISLMKDKQFQSGVISKPRIKVIVNKHIKIVYDTFDGDTISENDYDWSDYYFKRSYNSQKYLELNKVMKIYPLGFNYPVYGPGDFAWKRSIWSLLAMRPKNIRNTFVQVVRLSGVLSKILHSNGGRSTSSLRLFENLPRFDLPPRVLFLARAWQTSNQYNEAKNEERNLMNNMRATCIRNLRNEFPEEFLGGLEPTEYALKNYKDCVVENENIIRKINYLKVMRDCSICVATTGLLGSNGWKIAEYIAAAKAIVSEKLVYSVPGDFTSEKNYLEFSNPDECVEEVSRLIKGPELRYKFNEK